MQSNKQCDESKFCYRQKLAAQTQINLKGKDGFNTSVPRKAIILTLQILIRYCEKKLPKELPTNHGIKV